MYIIFLTHVFPVKGLSTTGAGNYVANMAQIMRKYGHKVCIITEAENRSVFKWNGIEVRKIRATRGFKDTGQPMPTYKKLLKNISRSIWYNWEVFKINKKNKVDIVQSVSTYGISMLRIKRIPYVVRISEYLSLWSGLRKLDYDYDTCLKSKRIDEEITYIGIKRADAVIAPSFLMQKLIFNKIRKESVVIESPIVMGDIDSLQFTETDIIRDKYWITYSAMNYRKEIHIIAQIIDDLLDEYPEMKYVVAGKDIEILYDNRFMRASSFFDIHIKRNKDRFLFLGEISDRERLFSIVKNAYACILPTRVDNLPNTCLESMALGKIVISTTCERGTSVEQLIVDGDTGLLAQVDNAKSLYNKIVQAMNMSNEERKSMEENAKNRVKNLTPENVYVEMMKVYSKLLTKGKRRKRL